MVVLVRLLFRTLTLLLGSVNLCTMSDCTDIGGGIASIKHGGYGRVVGCLPIIVRPYHALIHHLLQLFSSMRNFDLTVII